MAGYDEVILAAQTIADAADDAYTVARASFDFTDPVSVAILDAQTRAHATLTAVSASARVCDE